MSSNHFPLVEFYSIQERMSRYIIHVWIVEPQLERKAATLSLPTYAIEILFLTITDIA